MREKRELLRGERKLRERIGEEEIQHQFTN